MEKKKTEEKSLLKKAEKLRNNAPVKNTATNPHPILAKVALRIATIITLTLVAAFVLMIILPNLKKTFFTPKKELHEAMVTQQLLSVQELITQKYRYSDIITLKKSTAS
jgi:small-conductance mechanosensitive channel